MASGFKVTRTLLNTSAFARAIEDAAKPEVLRMLNETGEAAVRYADDIVSREFKNDRTPDRRHAGTRHLLGSFYSRVELGGGRTVGTVTLHSRAPKVKVASLNAGSTAHAIGEPGQFLFFPPSTTGGQYKKSAKFFKARQGQERRKRRVPAPVQHPGTLGSFFMQRALEKAVRERLRTSVTIPRR